ncbi:MAG: NUDIX domain-containing protein [Verrucomicrobia bacterium]|nr:NUDIX domain-containing protein [Verrucomicrobiota bacterium]
MHKQCRSNFGIIAKIQSDGVVSAVSLTVEEKFRKNALHKSWIFPGGSMNPGETDKINLVRELGEEISKEQKVLEIPHEDISFVLELKKPGDFGGKLTQNFWYIPMSEAITLRGEEQPDLLEPDGARLGQPTLMDIADIVTRKDLKLAHLAGVVVFMGRLLNPETARRYYKVEPEVSNAIRGRYGELVEPYLRKTYFFLERLRKCMDHKEYTQILYSYCKVLNNVRGKDF